MHLLFCAHLIIFYYILGCVELRHYYVYATFGQLTSWNLCVICNSNSFYSFIFKLKFDNDCSHIKGVHRWCRSRAEFGLVLLRVDALPRYVQYMAWDKITLRQFHGSSWIIYNMHVKAKAELKTSRQEYSLRCRVPTSSGNHGKPWNSLK